MNQVSLAFHKDFRVSGYLNQIRDGNEQEALSQKVTAGINYMGYRVDAKLDNKIDMAHQESRWNGQLQWGIDGVAFPEREKQIIAGLNLKRASTNTFNMDVSLKVPHLETLKLHGYLQTNTNANQEMKLLINGKSGDRNYGIEASYSPKSNQLSSEVREDKLKANIIWDQEVYKLKAVLRDDAVKRIVVDLKLNRHYFLNIEVRSLACEHQIFFNSYL